MSLISVSLRQSYIILFCRVINYCDNDVLWRLYHVILNYTSCAVAASSTRSRTPEIPPHCDAAPRGDGEPPPRTDDVQRGAKCRRFLRASVRRNPVYFVTRFLDRAAGLDDDGVMSCRGSIIQSQPSLLFTPPPFARTTTLNLHAFLNSLVSTYYSDWLAFRKYRVFSLLFCVFYN